jgi:outer membrane immunogenic protein
MMHRPAASLIGAACGLVFAQIASAADLSRWPPVYTSARPPAFNWSGCYFGVNAGVAWNHSDIATTVDQGSHFSLASNTALVGAAASGPTNGETGFVGGGQAGCNWQNRSLVFGVESDFNVLTPKAQVMGGTVTTLGPVSVTNSIETSWLATVRPRVGYAPYRGLIYLTGGVAFANFKFTQTYSEPNFPAFGSSEVSATKTGWTFGGGYEYAVTDKLSAKAEYLYARFSAVGNDWLLVTPIATSNQFHSSASDFDLNIIRVGLSYKFM